MVHIFNHTLLIAPMILCMSYVPHVRKTVVRVTFMGFPEKNIPILFCCTNIGLLYVTWGINSWEHDIQLVLALKSNIHKNHHKQNFSRPRCKVSIVINFRI